MARIIGGIGASHTPTIGYAKDTHKENDPGWKPIFDGFDVDESGLLDQSELRNLVERLGLTGRDYRRRRRRQSAP